MKDGKSGTSWESLPLKYNYKTLLEGIKLYHIISKKLITIHQVELFGSKLSPFWGVGKELLCNPIAAKGRKAWINHGESIGSHVLKGHKNSQA